MNTRVDSRIYVLITEDGTEYRYVTHERYVYDGYLVAKAIHDDRVGNGTINPVVNWQVVA